MSELTSMLDLATDLAVRAGRLTLGHFRVGTRPEMKPDDTPVTAADREAETLIRHEIERRHPGHAVAGEEFGRTEGTEAWRWWIDPIDGTKAFVRGVPLYGVLIGIERDGEMVAGVAEFPALGETLAAARGEGCRLNGRRCHVSGVDDLRRAVVSTTDAGTFASLGKEAAWRRVMDATWVRAGWGDAYGHALVASGRIEAMLDPAMHPWDAGPLPVLLAEAGGSYGDWQGRDTIHGEDGVSVNAALRRDVLNLLAGGGVQVTDVGGGAGTLFK
ncbi:MAG: inositol monophosphatase family protein [Trueperaceae bacterium]|nr:inositol monophosphatase family protein [Trueperaceae bacterium]